VEVRVAATAFLGSAAIRVLEQHVRRERAGEAAVTVVAPRGSGPARTLEIAGTPYVEA
jgi:hypothetical protein